VSGHPIKGKNNVETYSNPIYKRTSAASLFDKASTDSCTWANPHSNAFVDLDGDCLAGNTHNQP
jgi:integrin alpha FG-GAP repeat containing protein 1